MSRLVNKHVKVKKRTNDMAWELKEKLGKMGIKVSMDDIVAEAANIGIDKVTAKHMKDLII